MQQEILEYFRNHLSTDIANLGDRINTSQKIDVLYHYTIATALQNIIDGKTLWLTNSAYVNENTMVTLMGLA